MNPTQRSQAIHKAGPCKDKQFGYGQWARREGFQPCLEASRYLVILLNPEPPMWILRTIRILGNAYFLDPVFMTCVGQRPVS